MLSQPKNGLPSTYQATHTSRTALAFMHMEAER